MDRRRFLLTSLAGVLAVPLAAGAQQAGKIPRIGWLTSSVVHTPNVEAFREGMRTLGYPEVRLEVRAAAGRVDRLSADTTSHTLRLHIGCRQSTGRCPSSRSAV